MKQFKMGDWAMDESGKYSPFQVDEKDLSQLPVEHNYLLNNCKSWQPQPGEWCWFWDHEDSLIVLQKFVRHDVKNTFRATDLAGFEFNYLYCEPFIGELPSSLKDK